MSVYEPETAEVEVDETPEAEVTPEVEAEVEAPWALSQEDWTNTQGQLAALVEHLQQQQQQQPAEPEAEEDYDPFDPESVQRMIQREAAKLMQEQFGPYQGLLGMISSEKGEQLAKDELAAIGAEVGEFDQDMAFLIGSGLLNDEGADPSAALRQAATYARDFEMKTRADERAKVEEEMRTLGTAPQQTPVGTSAEIGGEVPTGPGRYTRAIENALERRRSTMPVG